MRISKNDFKFQSKIFKNIQSIYADCFKIDIQIQKNN